MKRFFNDFKKYARYMKYSTKAGLKAEIANSHLSWMWWFLDPICFMVIYTFIAEVVFARSEPYFPVYVFIGLTVWNFFSKVMTGSVKLVKNQKSILTRVYLPKWILSIEKMGNLFFKMCISFALVLILMIIFQVPFSLQLFNLIPVTIVLLVITFGFSTILLHFGVFMEDLSNIVSIFLRLLFYLSGICISTTRIPVRRNRTTRFCSVVTRQPLPLSKAGRSSFISRFPIICGCPFGWQSVLRCGCIGVATIYKYENSYAKVI